MSSVTSNIPADKFCCGQENYFEFKELFLLSMQAQGLDQILLGKQVAPLVEPTQDTTQITRDVNSNITGTVVTSKAVLSTIASSSLPTKDEFHVRERRAAAQLFGSVINDKQQGLDPTKTAFENWTKLEQRLGKGSMTEQIIARDQLLAARFNPTHESPTEYEEYSLLFKQLVQAAIAAGGEYKDDVLRTTFIVSINHDEYTNAASHIPIDASLNTTIATLRNTWFIHHHRKANKMAVQALAATVVAAAANTRAQSNGPRIQIRTTGNRGTGPCTNPSHGNNSQAAMNHDIAHCWAPGGGDIANRPAGYRVIEQPASSKVVTAPNVVTQPYRYQQWVHPTQTYDI
ncbi:hypothetical protein C8J56DRAFT_892483 [Mycena floridula]|nr:hypothetical protein C8J56DRAFT_892483 [Mycena floridula]